MMTPRSLIMICLACLAWVACRTQTDTELERVNAMVEEAQRLQQQQALLRWFDLTRGKRAALAETYAAHPQLFTPASFQFVDVVGARLTDRETVRELHHFSSYLRREFVEQHVAALRDSLFHLDPLLSAPGWTGLPDQPLSNNLQEGAQKRERLNRILTLRAALKNRQDSVAASLGFEHFAGLYTQLFYLNRAVGDSLAAALLDGSDSLIQSFAHTYAVTNAAPGADRAAPSALSRLLRWRRGEPYDSLFPARRQLSTAGRLLEKMGIQLSRQSGLRLDTLASLPAGLGAWPVAVDAPDDVRLAVRRSGGYPAAASLFFQIGETQQYLYAHSASVVDRQLYRSPVRSVFSLLLRNLWADSSWTAAVLAAPDELVHSLRRFVLLRQLQDLRLAATVVRFGPHRNPFTVAAAAELAPLFSRALAVPLNPDDLLLLQAYQPGYIQALEFLYAAVLQAELRQHLQKKFGTPWFEEIQAGRYLKALWNRAGEFSVPELGRVVGAPLSGVPLLLETLHGQTPHPLPATE